MKKGTQAIIFVLTIIVSAKVYAQRTLELVDSKPIVEYQKELILKYKQKEKKIDPRLIFIDSAKFRTTFLNNLYIKNWARIYADSSISFSLTLPFHFENNRLSLKSKDQPIRNSYFDTLIREYVDEYFLKFRFLDLKKREKKKIIIADFFFNDETKLLSVKITEFVKNQFVPLYKLKMPVYVLLTDNTAKL